MFNKISLQRRPAAIFLAGCLLALSSGQTDAQKRVATGKTHILNPSPATVVWGYYDAATPPVLRIKSGDAVAVHTLITLPSATLEAAGVKPDRIEPALREISAKVTNKGPGGHILNGPIYVEGAEIGDVLEVRIQAIELAIDYGFVGIFPGNGFLPKEFPSQVAKIVPLDLRRKVARFNDHVEIPLRPFFGSIGVAPPAASGRFDSTPPWIHGGNMDNKELVAGTTLFLPIHAPGALVQIGDGHAVQGNGEVCVAGLETSLRGKLQFIVRKDLRLRWPRAETPTAFITMGFDKDLTTAARIALREMIDFLAKEKTLSPQDAYMLASLAVDMNTTELVDINLGVQAIIPKAIFRPGAKMPIKSASQ